MKKTEKPSKVHPDRVGFALPPRSELQNSLTEISILTEVLDKLARMGFCILTDTTCLKIKKRIDKIVNIDDSEIEAQLKESTDAGIPAREAEKETQD